MMRRRSADKGRPGGWPHTRTGSLRDCSCCSRWLRAPDTRATAAHTWAQDTRHLDRDSGHLRNWCKTRTRNKMLAPWFLKDNSWTLLLTTGYLYPSITWWHNHGLWLVHSPSLTNGSPGSDRWHSPPRAGQLESLRGLWFIPLTKLFSTFCNYFTTNLEWNNYYLQT